MVPLPTDPPASPATEAPLLAVSTDTGQEIPDAGPESASPAPKEKEQIRETYQPATPRAEPSPLVLASSPSPVKPVQDEPLPSMAPLPADPPDSPATEAPLLTASTGTGQGVPDAAQEAGFSIPGEKEGIRGADQPATPRVEHAAITLRVSPPAISDSPRSRGELLSGEEPYRLGPEDVIKVDVWQEKELTVEVTVRPDGGVSLPLINYVQAAGLTAPELADVITQKLREYIKEPRVAVIVTQVNASKIYVLGNVLKPGHYPLRHEMTVLQALSHAGGFTSFASPRGIKIIRGAGAGQEIRKINYYRMIQEAGEGNYNLEPGDTIVVP